MFILYIYGNIQYSITYHNYFSLGVVGESRHVVLDTLLAKIFQKHLTIQMA